jgi:hypothetical protein
MMRRRQALQRMAARLAGGMLVAAHAAGTGRCNQ